MRRRLAATILAFAAAGLTLVPSTPAAGGGDEPKPGVLYSARQGDGSVRMVQIGRLRGRPVLLLDVEVECGGFTPEGRGLAVVEEGGRFEAVLDATDTDTSDTVTGIFDDIDGRVRPDAAVLEIDVDVEGEDNAGPTGSCDDTQSWRLRGRLDRGSSRIGRPVAMDADRVAVGTAGVFALRHADGGASELARIDPQSGVVTWRTSVGRRAEELATAGNAVWILDTNARTLRRLDAATGEEVARVPLVPGSQAPVSVLTPMVATESAVWIGADGVEQLFRVDAATTQVTSVVVPGGARALEPASAGVFAAIGNPAGGPRGGRLVRVDDTTTEVGTAELEEVGDDLAFDGTTLWMRSLFGTVTHHDPVTLAPRSGAFTFRSGTLTDGLVAATPGAWTATEHGLLAIDETLTRAVTVP